MNKANRGVCLYLALLPSLSFAEAEPAGVISPTTEQHARIYRSPEERREAGLGRAVTDWLRVSGLVEAESIHTANNFNNGVSNRENDRPLVNLQLGFEVTFFDWLFAELIFDSEYDFQASAPEDKLQAQWDEAFVDAELGKWGIKAGRLYLPFGEYYSHFVTGPMVEFGETRGDSVVVDYSFDDSLEVSAFVFDSRVKKHRSDVKADWGASVSYTSSNEAIRIGLGYLSDLAESDEQFLADDNNRYQHRVSAYNAYLLLGFDRFEITAEYLQANGRFSELEDSEDKPTSYNLELAYFPAPAWQLATRYERSDELGDQPREQYGLAATWAAADQLIITLEYLHGKYKKGFVSDESDNYQQVRDIIALQLSSEF